MVKSTIALAEDLSSFPAPSERLTAPVPGDPVPVLDLFRHCTHAHGAQTYMPRKLSYT